MSFKALIFTAALAVSSSAMATTTVTIPLFKSGNTASGLFGGSGPSTDFTFDLTGFATPISGQVLAQASIQYASGYTFTSATLDGGNLMQNNITLGGLSFQNWYFSGPLSAGPHHLVINGTSARGGGYIGTLGVVAAAPEPAAWSLMVLGVGGMGAALRTRRRRITA